MNKLLVTSGIIAGMLAMATPAFAAIAPAHTSTFDGTLSTNLTTGVDGVVVVAPTATPAAGTYTSAQSVTLSAAGANSIHYFLNTSDANDALTCSTGTLYSSATPIAISGSGLLRAIACYGSTASPIASFNYVINSSTTPAPSSGGGGGGGGGGGSIPAATPTDVYDFNGDGTIDILDFNILMVNWGSTTATKATGDTNGDGVVDILDFNNFMIHWTA